MKKAILRWRFKSTTSNFLCRSVFALITFTTWLQNTVIDFTTAIQFWWMMATDKVTLSTNRLHTSNALTNYSLKLCRIYTYMYKMYCTHTLILSHCFVFMSCLQAEQTILLLLCKSNNLYACRLSSFPFASICVPSSTTLWFCYY